MTFPLFTGSFCLRRFKFTRQVKSWRQEDAIGLGFREERASLTGCGVSPASSQEVLCSLTEGQLWNWSLQSISGSCDWQLSMRNATSAGVVAAHTLAGLVTASTHLNCLNRFDKGKISLRSKSPRVYMNILLGLQMCHHTWLLYTFVLGAKLRLLCLRGKHFTKWATSLNCYITGGDGGRLEVQALVSFDLPKAFRKEHIHYTLPGFSTWPVLSHLGTARRDNIASVRQVLSYKVNIVLGTRLRIITPEV